ncbi:MAG: ribonuclease J [Bacillota bacterium]
MTATPDHSRNDATVRLIPLGGMGEIGKNMCIWECDDEAIVVDAGLAFPEEEMLGVDIVIPDIEYLLSIRDKVSAIFITHGHEDHIGALPYVLREMTVPVYGPGLALGLTRRKLEEFGMKLPVGSKRVRPRDKIRTERFEVQFFRVNHSIADAMGLAVRTPVGLMVHSGDFKFDHTPIDGEVTDFFTLARLGDEGVRCLICDSTNAERPGYTGSERMVGEEMEEIFANAEGRVLFTTFASNIPRLQQVISMSSAHGRRVAVVGRSMRNSLEVSQEMGYLQLPPDTMIEPEQMQNYPLNQLTLMITGSQGEPMSALTRMSRGDDRRLKILEGDTVVIAANPVPGNEKLVYRTIDNLSRLGARVIYGAQYGVHVSGHASREELKFLLNLVRPETTIPVHGEYRHMKAFFELARSLGMEEEHILLVDNGDVVAFSGDSAAIVGRITSGNVLVDGLGVGDVGNVVLRDREQLSQDGIVIVVISIDADTGEVLAGPEVVTRGFVYVRESEELLDEAMSRVASALEHTAKKGMTDRGKLKREVRSALSSFIYDRLQRRPMILPVIMEVSE